MPGQPFMGKNCDLQRISNIPFMAQWESLFPMIVKSIKLYIFLSLVSLLILYTMQNQQTQIKLSKVYNSLNICSYYIYILT